MSGGLGEQLRLGLARLGHEAREHSLAGFDPRTLCRASLLPHWTADLAADLELVPADGFAGLVERLEHAGLVERGIDSTGAGPPRETFWVRSRHRREIGDHLRDRLGRALPGEYDELCRLVAERRAEDPRLRLWLEVRTFRDDPSGRKLMDRVDGLLAEDDLPDAAETVATARLVGDVLGGTLEGAVKRAQWRLDRAYRTDDDLDHLRGYFRRADIEAAIHRLITAEATAGGDPPWALHLMGDAGVGKTMVLRYLASGRLAEDFGVDPFPVARVDFDHLDPRYPEQRPVELLVALTDQLLGFASSRAAEQYHRWVHDSADALHEELAKPEPDKQRAKSLVAGAVERFARLVDELGGTVVLVLDTCEELAKLYAPGVNAPAIDRTFDLLEQLHERVPRVRVVFAGRRWLVRPSSPAFGGPSLLPRSYVEVLRVSGFTAGEAARFLDSREVPAALRAAVLERSVMPGTVRYNPFELESYCSWVRADPEVEAADLLDAPGDPYVERRIMARVHDPGVIAALPVAVALGRFDRPLITPTLHRMGIDPEAAFDALAAQEWVTVVRLRPDGRPRVVEVDEHIRERMRKVLAAKEIGVPLDGRRLGRDAAAVIEGNPLSEVVAETVEAAMRLLPVAEAAGLWAGVDRRVTDNDDWGWALQVTSRVAAVEAARPSPGPSALAAVLATQAAARVHIGQRRELGELWAEVFRTARRHPDPESRETLSLRAELGRVAAGFPIEPQDWADLVDRVTERTGLLDSLLAAAETMSANLRTAFLDTTDRALHTAAQAPAPVGTYALLLVEGLRLRRGWGSGAPQLVRDMENAPRPVRLADWVAPPGLLDRTRLVRVLAALYGDEEPLDEAVWTAWRADALGRCANDIDADRLVAATIDYELCHRVVPLESLPTDVPHHAWEATDWLHHGLARPLVVAVADALSAAGAPERAVDLLNRHRHAAVSSGDDAPVVEACDLALLRLCRRHRRTDWASVVRLAHDGAPRVRDEAWLVLRLVDGMEPNRSLLSEDGYWRCAPDSNQPPRDRPPADHLDVWEAETLATDHLTHHLLPNAPRARGVVALLAGEIRALTAPERGAALIRVASEEFAAAEDRVAAAHAADLARRRESRPGLDLTVHNGWDAPATVPVSTGYLTLTRRLFRARLADLRALSPVIVVSGLVWLAVAAVQFLVFPQGWVVLVVASGVLIGGPLAMRALADRELTPVDVVSIVSPKGGRVVVRTEDSLLPAELDGHRPGRLTVFANYDRWRQVDVFDLDRDTAPVRVGDIAVPARPARGDIGPVLGLDLARDLQGLAWEQWLGRSRAKSAPVANPLVFRIHETVRHEPLPGAPVYRGPAHLRPERSVDADPAPRLVHLVGTPVATTTGTHFRIGDAASGHPAPSRVADREELVDIDHVRTTMLVLQAEPVDGGPLPLDTNRAEFLRCAMTAVDRGVDTVLVVPPLSDALAAAVTRRVWQTGTPNTRDMLLLFRDIRRLVAGAEPDRAGTRAALDVVLFHRRVDPRETE